jgi:hypothetical protein
MKMFNKGQMSQTMTWVVATIIIVIILVASYFIANGDLISTNPTLPDKEKDFIATKSIDNFMSTNFEGIQTAILNKDYFFIEENLRPFLEKLEISRGGGGWNFNHEDFYLITFSSPTTNVIGLYNLFNIDFYVGSGERKTKFTFWEQCIGGCR